jgi:hypothetical protein
MAGKKTSPADHPQGNRSTKGKKRTVSAGKKKSAPKKTLPAALLPAPGELIIKATCIDPEWKKLLDQYPMIDSIQREDFPDHGVSFIYAAHFYLTKNTAKESSRAQQEFEDFFRDIGYEYDHSGNFDSRWYEGIGVKTS